jgi:hypothetical protein
MITLSPTPSRTLPRNRYITQPVRIVCGTLVACTLAVQALPVLAALNLPLSTVQAADSPVRLDDVKLLNTDALPLVLLYAATNVSDRNLEQFTVTVFVFDKDRQLKARQVAPGRRTLNAREKKFSTMVLDIGGIEAGDTLVAGVDQAQQEGSDDWWHVDLRAIAETKMKTPPPGK